jgi:hypothetical protein
VKNKRIQKEITMANTRNTTSGNKAATAPSAEHDRETHVCCYQEGGFYFAAGLKGFIMSTFHEVGDLCSWILDFERNASSKDGAHLVIHSHKPAVMRPHPVWEDIDEDSKQRIITELEERER